MSDISCEVLEIFVNEHLKEDLRYLEEHIKVYNDEIMEFVQLKNILQTLQDKLPDGYKTRMNIGANVFMQAKVSADEKFLVDVGKGYFLEFSPDEALKFVDFKINLLTKECNVLRDEAIKKKSEIKLALLCMAEKQKLYTS